jgi:hypothetical protein
MDSNQRWAMAAVSGPGIRWSVAHGRVALYQSRNLAISAGTREEGGASQRATRRTPVSACPVQRCGLHQQWPARGRSAPSFPTASVCRPPRATSSSSSRSPVWPRLGANWWRGRESPVERQRALLAYARDYSGHSLRVGAAQDMAAAGIGTAAILQAGGGVGCRGGRFASSDQHRWP